MFANRVADESGHGEGEIYLKTVPVRTNAQGYVRFATSIPLRYREFYISATATRLATGSTSQFSRSVKVGADTTPPRIANLRVTTESINGRMLPILSGTARDVGDNASGISLIRVYFERVGAPPIERTSSVVGQLANGIVIWRLVANVPPGSYGATVVAEDRKGNRSVPTPAVQVRVPN